MSNCSSIVIDLAHRVPGAPRLFKLISCARSIRPGKGPSGARAGTGKRAARRWYPCHAGNGMPKLRPFTRALPANAAPWFTLPFSASGGVPAEPQKLHELVQAGIGSLVGGHVMRAGLGTRPVLPVMPAVVIIIMVIMVRRTGAVIIIIIMAMMAACGQDGYG